MATPKQPPQVITGFLVLGVAVVGLFAYAMTLRGENEELRARVVALGGDTELVPEPASGESEDTGSEDGNEQEPAGGDEVIAPDLVPEGTGAAGSLALSPSERATLSSQLGFIDPNVDRRVWLTVTFGDPEAAQFASALGEVFTDAGFDVQPTTVARFPIRPGIYFMSADEEPPEHVSAILSAIEATGREVTSGRGYRAFYQEKKREDPTWNGFDMAADQPFVIAIGRAGQ